MPQQKTPKYTGKLAERLPAPKDVETLPPDNRIVDIRLAVSFELALLEWEHDTEIENRMGLLFDHFEIPRPAAGHELESWRAMAFKLAITHVGGFQRKQLGPKLIWGTRQISKLHVDVKRKIREGQSERQACYHLAKQEPWRSFVRSKATDKGDEAENRAAALRQRFKKTQQERHIIVGLIKGFEERHPERLDEKLQILSEQLNF